MHTTCVLFRLPKKSTNNTLTVTASYQRHMKFFLTAARSLPDLPARQLKPAKPDTDTPPVPLHRPGILAMASVLIGAVDEQSRCARESQVKIDSTSHVQMEPCRWRLLRLQPAPVLNHVVPHLLFSTRGCAVLLKGTRENHLRLATFAGNINCADSKNKSGNERQHVRSEQFLSEEIQKHCTKKEKTTITGKKKKYHPEFKSERSVEIQDGCRRQKEVLKTQTSALWRRNLKKNSLSLNNKWNYSLLSTNKPEFYALYL